MVMSEVGEPSRAMGVVDGVLQAFATGTFIYVTFFEILQEEIDPRDTSIGKVTSALAGPYKTLFSIPSRRVYFIPSVIVNLMYGSFFGVFSFFLSFSFFQHSRLSSVVFINKEISSSSSR